LKAVVVVPARRGSSRLPSKPLIPIKGKKLIEWVLGYLYSLHREGYAVVCLATDDPEILNIGKQIGVDTCLTSSDIPSGTLRTITAFYTMGYDAPWLVNVQGDEILITASIVRDFIESLDYRYLIWTMGCPLHDDDILNPNAVKVLSNGNECLSFYRLPPVFPHNKLNLLKHVGVYAYHKKILTDLRDMTPSLSTSLISLEQVEWQRHGIQIGLVQVKENLIAIDTPDDIKKVEQILSF